ncbi:MAG: acyltransferase family protein [Saccharofermentans sp.]|nr:acyltransferase family protein [Saccharofermentans sp.]
MRDRIKYFDVLRIACFAAVLFYHAIIQLYLSDYYPIEVVSPLYSNANIGLGPLAVGIFFMLSGAGLMISTHDKLEIKSFYIKRLLRLLIPFYVTCILYIAYCGLIAHDLDKIFRPDIPKWRIIFNFLGMDEWISAHGITTFDTTIGEWFLGCLIVLYVLFPIFRFLLLKNKWMFLGITTLAYILLAIFYPFSISPDLSIIFKGYEFILGMYLGLFWDKIPTKILYATIPLLIIGTFLPVSIPIPYVFKITILALSVFISISFLEPHMKKIGGKTLTLISGLTYPIFLTHHQVIYRMTPGLRPYMSSPFTFVIMFVLELIVIVILALIVNFISSKLFKLLSSLNK